MASFMFLFNRRCCIATHAVEVIIRGPPDAPMTSLIDILVANKANEVWRGFIYRGCPVVLLTMTRGDIEDRGRRPGLM